MAPTGDKKPRPAPPRSPTHDQRTTVLCVVCHLLVRQDQTGDGGQPHLQGSAFARLGQDLGTPHCPPYFPFFLLSPFLASYARLLPETNSLTRLKIIGHDGQLARLPPRLQLPQERAHLRTLVEKNYEDPGLYSAVDGGTVTTVLASLNDFKRQSLRRSRDGLKTNVSIYVSRFPRYGSHDRYFGFTYVHIFPNYKKKEKKKYICVLHLYADDLHSSIHNKKKTSFNRDR